MASLQVVSGPDAGACFRLVGATMRGGRDPELEIVLSDTKVSRVHFEIGRDTDGYVVRELQSKNGVFVNAQAVRETRLADGDFIHVGHTVLQFRAEAESNRADASVGESLRSAGRDNLATTREDWNLK